MSLRIFAVAFLPLVTALALADASRRAVGPETVQSAVRRLVAKHGQAHSERIRQGVSQVAQRWWTEDGDGRSFEEFCEANFLTEENDLNAAAARLEAVLEQVDGHLHEVRRTLTTPLDLETGPVSSLDGLLGDLDLAAHVDDDLFRTKVAFLALLNFPVHSLAQRLEQGASWSRDTWARSRMMDRFNLRVPAPVIQEMTRTFTAADRYIAEYNIRMGRLITPDGKTLFDEDLKLISHWGLRDELASRYADAGGLAKQRMIRSVMDRIVRQEIPVAVIDNPDLLWCPDTNEVRSLRGATALPAAAATREPDTRYARLLDVFHAVRAADPYSPTAPTFVARRFELDRQVPKKRVEEILLSVLDSDEVRETAHLVQTRLGRPLEPFDIWYSGFKSRSSRSEEELDRIVRSSYPNVGAFQGDLPRILEALGFSKDKARWLADHIVVDPSRGAGHAMGAARREDKAHLRTRISRDGMDYKGYNIAIHELGHNVEQVFSLNGIDRWFLSGVPNNAFTEAFAFVFQNRDLELLGIETGGEEQRRLEALATLWSTYEISGVALVDMKVWDGLYAHPDAKPGELREATLAIARDVWNAHFAPVFGVRDQDILAVYSHMIVYGLYLPDYPMGHIIAFQVAKKLRSENFGIEFERMAQLGRMTPDAWMRAAVGKPIASDALLAEAREALAHIR